MRFRLKLDARFSRHEDSSWLFFASSLPKSKAETKLPEDQRLFRMQVLIRKIEIKSKVLIVINRIQFRSQINCLCVLQRYQWARYFGMDHVLVVAEFAFESRGAPEISLGKGEMAVVVAREMSEWVTIVKTGGGRGMVPEAFVRPLTGLATVQFDYSASAPGQITIRVGERIRIVQFIDEHWAYGISASNEAGMFPVAYSELLANEEFEKIKKDWIASITRGGIETASVPSAPASPTSCGTDHPEDPMLHQEILITGEHASIQDALASIGYTAPPSGRVTPVAAAGSSSAVFGSGSPGGSPGGSTASFAAKATPQGLSIPGMPCSLQPKPGTSAGHGPLVKSSSGPPGPGLTGGTSVLFGSGPGASIASAPGPGPSIVSSSGSPGTSQLVGPASSPAPIRSDEETTSRRELQSLNEKYEDLSKRFESTQAENSRLRLEAENLMAPGGKIDLLRKEISSMKLAMDNLSQQLDKKTQLIDQLQSTLDRIKRGERVEGFEQKVIEKVVEKIVEKPVVVEKIVEKIVPAEERSSTSSMRRSTTEIPESVSLFGDLSVNIGGAMYTFSLKDIVSRRRSSSFSRKKLSDAVEVSVEKRKDSFTKWASDPKSITEHTHHFRPLASRPTESVVSHSLPPRTVDAVGARTPDTLGGLSSDSFAARSMDHFSRPPETHAPRPHEVFPPRVPDRVTEKRHLLMDSAGESSTRGGPDRLLPDPPLRPSAHYVHPTPGSLARSASSFPEERRGPSAGTMFRAPLSPRKLQASKAALGPSPGRKEDGSLTPPPIVPIQPPMPFKWHPPSQ